MGGHQKEKGLYKAVLIAMTCFIALCGVAAVALGASVRLMSGEYLFSIPHVANISVFLLVLGSVLVSGSITGCVVAVKESKCAVITSHMFNVVGMAAQIAVAAWIFAIHHLIHSWYTANSCTACQDTSNLVSMLLIASAVICLAVILAQLVSIVMTVFVRRLKTKVPMKYANGYSNYPTLPIGYTAAPMPAISLADPRSVYYMQAAQPAVYFTYGGRGQRHPAASYGKPGQLVPYSRQPQYPYPQAYVNGFAYSTYDPRFSSRPSTPRMSQSGRSMP